MFKVCFCEPLENCQYRYTETVASGIVDHATTAAGVTVQYEAADSTTHVTVSGLPTHAMVRIYQIGNQNGGEEAAEEQSEGQFANLNRPIRMSEGEEGEEGEEGGIETVFHWTANSSSSVSFDVPGLPEEETGGEENAATIDVDIWNPTINASGGGSMAEPSVQNQLFDGTVGFTVDRDSPLGWGNSSLDEPIPATMIQVERGGSATFGEDYTKASGSEDLPDGTLTLPSAISSKTFAIRTIDDSITESGAPDLIGNYDSYDTVTWTVHGTSNPDGSTKIIGKIFDDAKWAYYSPDIILNDPADNPPQINWAGAGGPRYNIASWSTTQGNGLNTVETYYTDYIKETYNAWGPPLESSDYNMSVSNTVSIPFDQVNIIHYGNAGKAVALFKYVGNGPTQTTLVKTNAQPSKYGSKFKVEGFVSYMQILEDVYTISAGTMVSKTSTTILGDGVDVAGRIATIPQVGWRVTEMKRCWLDEETTPWPA